VFFFFFFPNFFNQEKNQEIVKKQKKKIGWGRGSLAKLVEFTLGSKKTSRKKLFENMTKICGNKKNQ
jgi:hypothetical protein